MSNREINETYLKYRGYRQMQGNKDNLSMLMFFFMMDASKSFYDRSVAAMNPKHMSRRFKTRMDNAYHLFFKRFFTPFTDEQNEYILDKVDAYEKEMEHHFLIADIAMQEANNDKPTEFQQNLSRAWLANLLAADAQDFHKECWLDGRGKPTCDVYIDQFLKASKEFAKLEFGEGPYITDRQFNRIQKAVKVIANKTMDFIYRDYLKETGQNDKQKEEKQV